MIKKLLLLCCCLLAMHTAGFSQEQRVSGRIVSAKDSQPLPGVSVSLKGSSNIVSTDGNGAFSIGTPAGKSTLVLTFVGFLRKEVEVNAGQSGVQIRLDEDVQQLN